jgi:hypothetical protein
MRAFIVRPFGVKQGIDFDRVERELIDPALTALKVTGRTTAEIVKQGNIRTDMFQRLLTADLVVADLSIHNANVFYELGIRHALRGKGTFLLRSAQDAYPFDLQTDRYFTYDKDNPAAILAELTKALEQTNASEDQDSPVFRLLPDLEEQDRSRFLAVPRGFREEVELVASSRRAGDLGLLAAEAEGFEWESEGWRIVGRAQFNLNATRGARATWEKVRQIYPFDLEANTRLGTIYQRLKDLTQSNLALKRALESKGLQQYDRAEVYALLGRNAKTRWKDDWSAEPSPAKQREKALRSPFLKESCEAYERGFNTDLNHFYSGLNAVAMLTILSELARALPEVWAEPFEEDAEAARELDSRQKQLRKLATAVEVSIEATQARLKREGSTDLWVEISAADLCCLTSTRATRVADAYRKALAGAPDFAQGAVRDQLLLYRDLEILPANIKAALAIPGLAPEGEGKPAAQTETPRVLLFTGHMIDAPKREKPRFPPDKEDVARQAIRKAIEDERERPGGVAFGIAGGASGGDILFHEICAELGIPTRLFLALPKDPYIEESVAPAEGDWVQRFDRLTGKLPMRVLAESKDLPPWLAEKPDYDIWQRNNLWMLHNALAEGDQSVTLIALWNGQEGDGPGGTGDLVQRVKKRQARAVILDTKKLFGVG